MPFSATVVLCRCAERHLVPAGRAEELLQKLSHTAVAVQVVDELCRLAARRDSRLGSWAAGAGRLCVVACFPRAVKWLFAAAGADPPDDSRLFNLRSQTAEQVFAALTQAQAPGLATGGANPIAPAQESADRDGWVAWFPVIDYSRCAGCLQCLNFCLFGVYAGDPDRKVRVERPANCKTDCPACARVCPSAAIMFPKYHAAPINGDEVRQEDLQKQGMTGNLADVADADLYLALRQRAKRAAEIAAAQSNGQAAPAEPAARPAELP